MHQQKQLTYKMIYYNGNFFNFSRKKTQKVKDALLHVRQSTRQKLALSNAHGFSYAEGGISTSLGRKFSEPTVFVRLLSNMHDGNLEAKS